MGSKSAGSREQDLNHPETTEHGSWQAFGQQRVRALSEERLSGRSQERRMISRSGDFDLGRDRTRIKDLNDAVRQQVTVDALLGRFFDPKASQRFEIQIVADE